ncbi:MAG TPA: sulfite exporter TauE/SafE family protein [Methanoregulaceae archaeon]|nr:sulfite exporter TauE/SafE family protein [Methanoregulaceae archaeon]
MRGTDGISITVAGLALAGLAAFLAGIVNALAGGGTLITFPVLVATGIPEVVANVTNTVALCPGYLGGAFAQRRDLAGQGPRIRILVPVAVLCGILGGILLLFISAEVFHLLVPFLVLFSAVLLAVQERVRDWISLAAAKTPGDDRTASAVLPVGIAAVYNGYFGAGGSVVILAVLGLFIRDTLTRLNALKQVVTLAANVAAAVFFLFSGYVLWVTAIVMAIGALAGGAAGGHIAGRIDPDTLRRAVVSIGIVVGIILLIRL